MNHVEQPMAASASNFSHDQITVGLICALPPELHAAISMLDERYKSSQRQDPNDHNHYEFGRIENHKIVISCLAAGDQNTSSAATLANQMSRSFPSIRFGLLVGIGGGVPAPGRDIRLGDVVISQPQKHSGGVIQYDLGVRAAGGKFIRTGVLNKPPPVLRNALASLNREDQWEESKVNPILLEAFQKSRKLQESFSRPDERDDLFSADYDHCIQGQDCKKCDQTKIVNRQKRREIKIHYGTIASGNSVIRSAAERDKLSKDLEDVFCFEKEAAGLMDHFPCLVVRGICDYADTHKADTWQNYAALTAAAVSKRLLIIIPSREVEKTVTAQQSPISHERSLPASGVPSGQLGSFRPDQQSLPALGLPYGQQSPPYPDERSLLASELPNSQHQLPYPNGLSLPTSTTLYGQRSLLNPYQLLPASQHAPSKASHPVDFPDQLRPPIEQRRTFTPEQSSSGLQRSSGPGQIRRYPPQPRAVPGGSRPDHSSFRREGSSVSSGPATSQRSMQAISPPHQQRSLAPSRVDNIGSAPKRAEVHQSYPASRRTAALGTPHSATGAGQKSLPAFPQPSTTSHSALSSKPANFDSKAQMPMHPLSQPSQKPSSSMPPEAIHPMAKQSDGVMTAGATEWADQLLQKQNFPVASSFGATDHMDEGHRFQSDHQVPKPWTKDSQQQAIQAQDKTPSNHQGATKPNRFGKLGSYLWNSKTPVSSSGYQDGNDKNAHRMKGLGQDHLHIKEEDHVDGDHHDEVGEEDSDGDEEEEEEEDGEDEEEEDSDGDEEEEDSDGDEEEEEEEEEEDGEDDEEDEEDEEEEAEKEEEEH